MKISLKENSEINRNEGSETSKGLNYGKEQSDTGNMLLSKNFEMFLPENCVLLQPIKGCYVWDLDGQKYRYISNGYWDQYSWLRS